MKKMINILSVCLVCCGITATTGCSDDDFGPDAPRDWAGTTTFFNSTDERGFQTYYTPAIGRCGDPMPFYDPKAQDFKVMYLQEYDNNGACYHPFWAVSTKDGATYESLGEIIPTGTSTAMQDASLGTGCAVYNEADGLYYVYYTGYNVLLPNREVVMRATSPDFKTWTKDNQWALKGVDYGYAATDFRDPQVFKADDGLWHMVISSNLKFADFKSTDLKTWEHVGSFNMVWDRMCECPDIFQMGNYWYIVYSEGYRAPWSRKVKYMMATSFEGLKRCFDDPGANWPRDGHEGVLDSRAFYAGKTASNGVDRYIWGWCPYRVGTTIHDRNLNVGADSEPAWSGALVCHKLIQHSDGTLSFGQVPAMAAKYNQAQTVAIVASNGYNNGVLSGDDAYVLYSRLGTANHISFTVTTSNNWDKFGISFVRSTDPEFYYTMVVNPEGENTRKINFEQEGFRLEKDNDGNDVKVSGKGFIEGIDGYNFARPEDNVYKIDLFTDNSVCVLYINDVCAYTQRIYGIQKNCWSINNYGGSITISDLRIFQQ
jgi:beta-fructofuranosidase